MNRSWQPPRSSRLLWQVWDWLSRLEGWLWSRASEAAAVNLDELENDTTVRGRVLSWWFWDGPGYWLTRKRLHVDRRWQRARFARRKLLEHTFTFKEIVRSTSGLEFYWPGHG